MEKKKLNDNMPVSRQLAESFFNAFAGLAYTILPTSIPIIDLTAFQKNKEPSLQKKCEDLLYHWASSSILSVTGDKAQEMLLSEPKSNGTYIVRISHHYLWALATVGINKILNEDKFSKHVGPIIICYKNNDSFYEQLITFQVMHLTTISNQLASIPELRHCYICNQLCFKHKVTDSKLLTQINPINGTNHLTFNNINIQSMDMLNSGGSSLSNSSSNIISSEFSPEFELLSSSLLSVNMNDGTEHKRMKRQRNDNIKLENPIPSTNNPFYHTPIYCIDNSNDPTILSVLQIKIIKTPDIRLMDAVIKICYHENRTYSVECEKIMYTSKCLVPFIGKPSPVETKILVINDPKINSTYFLKYIPKMKVWCCGVIEADTSYEVNESKSIFTDPPMGDTTLYCLSKVDLQPFAQEKELPFLNSNLLMDTTPLNFEGDNNELDFSYLNSPSSLNTSWMINTSKKSPLSSPRSPRSPLSTSGILGLNTNSINPLFSFN